VAKTIVTQDDVKTMPSEKNSAGAGSGPTTPEIKQDKG